VFRAIITLIAVDVLNGLLQRLLARDAGRLERREPFGAITMSTSWTAPEK